jgi:hypothetical protein
MDGLLDDGCARKMTQLLAASVLVSFPVGPSFFHHNLFLCFHALVLIHHQGKLVVGEK